MSDNSYRTLNPIDFQMEEGGDCSGFHVVCSEVMQCLTIIMF